MNLHLTDHSSSLCPHSIWFPGQLLGDCSRLLWFPSRCWDDRESNFHCLDSFQMAHSHLLQRSHLVFQGLGGRLRDPSWYSSRFQGFLLLCPFPRLLLHIYYACIFAFASCPPGFELLEGGQYVSVIWIPTSPHST